MLKPLLIATDDLLLRIRLPVRRLTTFVFEEIFFSLTFWDLNMGPHSDTHRGNVTSMCTHVERGLSQGPDSQVPLKVRL